MRTGSPLSAARLPALLVLGLVLVLSACGSDAPSAEAWRGSGDTIELTAWKLECPGCTAKIKEEIGKIEGVVSVAADVETSKVTVRISDPAKRDEVIPRIRAAVHATDKKIVGEDPS